LNNVILIAKAFSDSNRVRALAALRGGELCVCQIIELLGLAPSTVSKHMSVLKQAGLVASRKEERWMYYRLPEENDMPSMVRGAVKWALQALESDEIVRRDQKALAKITKQNPSSLCKMQRCK
jgi:ArsR family transcriptional regulator, arsenate/arsenite/antimonite-responsive transcriptional repressor